MYKLLLASLLCVNLAHGLTYTFGLDLEGTASAVLADGGVNLTVNNPVQTTTGTNLFAATADGVLISNSVSGNVLTFQLTFDADVNLTAYSIGNVVNSGGTFSLSVDGGGSRVGLAANAVQSYSISTPLYVPQATVVTFTATDFTLTDAANFGSITAEAVPEPSQTASMIGVLAGVFVIMCKRKRAT